MFESSKEENLLLNKKIANQIEEIDRLQQENKSLKVNSHKKKFLVSSKPAILDQFKLYRRFGRK